MLFDFGKKRREMEMASARRAIAEVARREGKTIEEVRASMIEAIEEAYKTPDPNAQALWAQIPREGEIPTPEELIIWAGKRLR